jgi:murein DD-endopeptidase MepM/ murein hydrolase activator NlpD
MKRAWLILFICLFSLTFIICDTQTNSAYTDPELEEAQKNLDELNAKQAALEKELNETKKNKKSTVKSKQLIEEQIENTNDEIETLNDLIDDLNNKLVAKIAELEASQKAYDEYYAKYRARVRANYEAGELSYLEVVLTSDNFSDLLTRMDLVSEIAEYDNILMDKMQAEINTIQENKEQIEYERKSQNDAVARLGKAKTDQEVKSRQLEEALANLEDDEAALRKEQEEFEKAEKELEARISQLLDKQKAYIGGNFIWPLPGHSKLSSGYGWRTLYGRKEFHPAIDIPAPKGTPIIASNNGTVVYAQWTNTGGGNKVVIDHAVRSQRTTIICPNI